MKQSIVCFDSHFHIIDPNSPLVANQGYFPEPFSASDYMNKTAKLNLNLKGGAVVSGSFQAFDISYLERCLPQLGSDYVAVINLSDQATDEEIYTLHQLGVRAVRFNLYRGGSETLNKLETLARRVYELVNWHVELYIDSSTLNDMMPLLLSLPLISIDHLGLSESGFYQLLRLVKQGAYVKADRFSILNFDIKQVMRTIYDANSNSLMFSTDLPGTRAPRLINQDDLSLFFDTFSADELHKVMYSNAHQLYFDRFD